MIRWAANRLSNGVPFSRAQVRLIEPAMTRLRALHDGKKDDRDKRKQTYRSELAKRRIEPDLAFLTQVEAALGN